MKKILILIFGILFLISLISAPSVGTSDMTKGKVVYTPPEAPINYSTITTNYSTTCGEADFWDALDTPADIEYSDVGGDSFWDSNVDLGIRSITAGNIFSDAYNSDDGHNMFDWDDANNEIDLGHNLEGEDWNITADYFYGSWNGSVNYVPYTGADKNVDLGIYNLTTTGLGTFGGVTSLDNHIKQYSTLGDYGLIFDSGTVTHPFTGIGGTYDNINTNTYGYFAIASGTYGGMTFASFRENAGVALAFNSHQGVTGTTLPGFVFQGWKSDGSDSRTAITANDQLIDFRAGSTSKLRIYGDGDIVQRADNQYYYVGAAKDAYITYDGTNMIINPKVVGSGNLKISGDVNITEDLIVGGNFTGNQYYGEMWYHNHTATEINFADGVYYNLTFDNSLTNGFIFNDAEDYLEAQIAGLYKACWMASGDGQNNHIYFTDVTINGAIEDKCEGYKKLTAGGDIVTMNGCCFIELSVGDEIKLATADIGGTGIGNYYSSNLNLVRIGS